jgi:hypothetical protein
MSKTPYEIRLDLVTEARHILQAQADDPSEMPSTEQVIAEARKLNEFVSESQPRPQRKDRY